MTTYSRDFATIPDFVAWLNATRLANKDKWFWYQGYVAGVYIENLKIYNTWVQILQFGGYAWRASNHCGSSPTEFKRWIADEVAQVVRKQG